MNKVKKACTRVFAALLVLILLSVGFSVASAADSTTITSIGFTRRRVYWNGYNGGVYHINKKADVSTSFPLTDPGVAFCFENKRLQPEEWDARSYYSAKLTEYTGKNKEYIIRALYYGWNGPGNIFGSAGEKGYLITRAVLSQYYSGYGDSVYEADTTLYNLVKSSTVNPARFKFSTTKLQFQLTPKKDASGNTIYYQKTNTVQLLSADDYANKNGKIDKNSYIELTVPTPKDTSTTIYLVNDTKGKEYKSGTTTKINGGDKFHFTTRGGNAETISLSQACNINVKGIFIATSGTYQTLGKAMYVTDKQTLSLSIAPPSVQLQLNKVSANPDLTNGNSCYSLEGAVYGIYTDEACTNPLLINGKAASITTDSSGNGVLGSNVTVGNYWAKETTASKGFTVDNNAYKFKNTGLKNSDGNYVYKLYDAKEEKYEVKEKPDNDPVTIALQKKNARTGETGKRLEGAEYAIEYYDGFYTKEELEGKTPTRRWLVVTDKNGLSGLDDDHLVKGIQQPEFYKVENNPDPVLPLGTVKIYETKAPEGFELSPEQFVTQITPDSEGGQGTSQFNFPTFDEVEIPGKIKIIKTSEDGVIAGVHFKVSYTDENGEAKTDDVYTGSDGTIVKDYYEGTYTITEVVDETKYFPQEPQTVSVKADETATVKFHNKLATTDFTIRKTSTDGKVEGITFHIKDNVTGTVLDKVTDKNGYITVEGLTVNRSYTVTEEVPDGYEPQSPKTITIKADTVNLLTFNNIRQTGNLKIIKTSSDGKRDGFAFTVRPVGSYNFLTPISGLITDKNGIIDDERLQNIPTGDYIITEVGDYWYYYEETQPRTVTVTKNSAGTYTEVRFHNTLKTKPVKIVKTSKDGNVAGITFRVTGYFGMNFVTETREYVTDENGVIAEDLPASDWYDEYTIEEVVPDGYEEQPPQTITLDPDSTDTVEVNFNNVSKPDIKIVKTSDDGVVEGISFNVSYTDPNTGTVMTTSEITDENGVILLKSVASNIEYTITEEVPDGYAQQPPQTVTPKPGETEVVSFHNTVPAEIKIVKTSEDGVVSDVWFAVYAGGSLVGQYSTDENGIVLIENLPAYADGELISYTVEELGLLENGAYAVPERYNIPEAQSKTLLRNDTTVFEFYNSLKRGSITIEKRGTADPDMPVPDVVLNVYDSAGKLLLFSKNESGEYTPNDENGVADVVTDSNGNASIVNLIYGEYTVNEVKAATGYHLLSEGVTIMLDSESVTQTIHNTEKASLPTAGSLDKLLWLLIGGSVAVCGLIILIITTRKKRKEESKVTKLKRYSKNFLTLFIVTLTLVSMFCVGAGAANPYHINFNRTGSIEFWKYEMEGDAINNATTPGDGEFKTPPEGAKPLEGVEFTIYQIKTKAQLADFFKEDGKELPKPTEAETMVASVPANRVQKNTTDSNGYIKFDNLELGIYYVKETFSPSQVRQQTAPFVIAVPSTNAAGTDWLYDLTVQPKNQTKYTNVTLHKTAISTDTAKNDTDLAGFTFSLEEKITTINSATGVTTDTWTPVAVNGSVGTTGGTAPTGATWTTGANGKFTIDHLATAREYRFKEVSATDKQYIVDSTVYYEFTVNADGTVTYDSDNFKNTEPAADNTLEVTNETPEVHKSVSTDKTNWMQDVTQDINKTVYWKVSADIPEIVSKLKTYKIIDTLSKGLTYNDLEVYVEADGEAISKNDYTVTVNREPAGETVITVDVTNKTTLAGHKVCDVILTTTLNEDAIIGGDNPNEAKLVYTNDVDTDSTFDKDTETPEAHTGGYTWYKKSSDMNAPLANAKFKVYRSSEDAQNGTNVMTNSLILELIIYFSMMVLICINVYAGVQYHKTKRRIYLVVMVLSTVLCLSGAIKAGMLIYERI